MGKLCLIFNTPSLYRQLIYKEIDRVFDCDWYFGDWDANVKSFDTKSLSHPVRFLHVRRPGKSWFYFSGINPLLRKTEYDKYLMIGDVHDLATWRMLISKKIFHRKKKIYFWTHGWYGKETNIERMIKKMFYKMADGVFLYGNHAKKLMIEEGFKESKLFVIHNSLEYNTQLSLRQSLKPSDLYSAHFNNNNKNIIFIGRLTEVKHLDLLIKSVAKLKGRGEYYNITFVGDGTQRKQLENLTSQLGLSETIWFYGASYDEKINAEFIFNADLCVSPGNVGLTGIHTMMFGTPVITHDNFPLQMPEFEAVIPNKTGAFFKQNSADSLSDTIQEWFNVKGKLREVVRRDCYNEIDSQWNPDFQMKIFKSVLDL